MKEGKPDDETRLVLPAAAIERLHARIVDGFKERLPHLRSERLKIASDISTWENVVSDALVRFQLRGRGERTSRELSAGEVFVFALQAESYALRERATWFSWFEDWRPSGSRGTFRLRTAGLTFFRGPVGSSSKDQLLRAEWDTHTDENLSRPQPHWHIDTRAPEPPQELEPAEIGAPREIDLEFDTGTADAVKLVKPLDRVHLGMGGWRNKAERYWCVEIKDVANDFTSWALHVVEHVRTQLARDA